MCQLNAMYMSKKMMYQIQRLFWRDEDEAATAAKNLMTTGAKPRRGGSGVQQRYQPRQTDSTPSLLEMAVVRSEGTTTATSRNLMTTGHGEGVAGNNEETNRDRPTTCQACS
jgi:hypothetical protein